MIFRTISLGLFGVALILFVKGQTTNALCFIILSVQMEEKYLRLVGGYARGR